MPSRFLPPFCFIADEGSDYEGEEEEEEDEDEEMAGLAAEASGQSRSAGKQRWPNHKHSKAAALTRV